jgi:hypothetical protein
MINYNDIPTAYSENSASLVDQIPVLTINSAEDVDITTVAMKNLKKFIKDAEAQKKEAIKPHEERRKAADADLKDARTQKKEAGEPYEGPISKAKELEAGMRDSINEYTNRKIAEERAAQAAAAEAKMAAGAEEAPLDPPTNLQEDLSQNVGYQTKMDFEVVDINAIPENYLVWVADPEVISAFLAKSLPGISFQGRFTLTAINEVSANFAKADINRELIMEDLKKLPDLEIPGINRVYQERVVIR